MKIIDANEYREEILETGIALGNFDGIHLGHRELIKKVVDESEGLGLSPGVLFFENHTRAVTDKKNPFVLTSNHQKQKIVESLGIEVIYKIKFDEDIMKLSGREFIEKILINKMNSKLLVVGFDYRFGYKASCNAKDLKEMAKEYGIEVFIVEPVQYDGKVIGSSQIRELINGGFIKEANELLARPYSIEGRVVHGANRGNKLGFPTANLEVDSNYIVPKTGVYKSRLVYGGNSYKSITNIGYNPTFNENKLKIETHILNFNKNIYDEIVEIELLDYLREDIKFDKIEDLVDQIKKDIDSII